MREIKFRAWCTEAKTWLQITGFETAETKKSNGYTLDGMFHDGDFVGRKGIVLMQSTGLKDKNGVEIYVGDTWREPDGTEHLVEYKEMFAGYVPFATDGGCGCCAHRMGLDPKSGEVIGNIYDNPELLEGDAGAK